MLVIKDRKRKSQKNHIVVVALVMVLLKVGFGIIHEQVHYIDWEIIIILFDYLV